MRSPFRILPQQVLMSACAITLTSTFCYVAVVGALSPRAFMATAFGIVSMLIVVYWFRGEPRDDDRRQPAGADDNRHHSSRN